MVGGEAELVEEFFRDDASPRVAGVNHSGYVGGAVEEKVDVGFVLVLGVLSVCVLEGCEVESEVFKAVVEWCLLWGSCWPGIGVAVARL